ncbi:MAG: tetratricopeptide repeat protein, partial [Gemmataceae bacterium]|nr:tetratricopeptide repeat protein [Gemmataceae bacterium]
AAGLAVVAAAALLVFVRTSDPAPDAPEPRTPEEFIQRGRELVAEGRVEAAVADFAAAVTLEPTGPRPLAYLAYGLTMRASKEAVDAGRDAVAAGAGNAAVYTNLGSAYLQRGKPGLALEVLDEAVLLDPELVPARYNRAIARFRTSVRDARLPDRGCVDDMLVVLRADPPAAEVYFQAARMWAASAHLDPSLRDRAVEFLAAAARLGDDPSKFAAEPTLEENLRGHRGYEQVCGRPKLPGSARQMNLRSVDPDPR